MDPNQFVFSNTPAEVEQSAKMLCMYLDAKDIGLAISDFQSGIILAANQRYCKNMNQSHSQIIGRNYWTFTGDEHTHMLCPLEKLIDKQGRPLGPYTWTHHDKDKGVWMRYTNEVIEWRPGLRLRLMAQEAITQEMIDTDALASAALYDQQPALPNGRKLQEDSKAFAGSSSQALINLRLNDMQTLAGIYGKSAASMLMRRMSVWLQSHSKLGGALYCVNGNVLALLLRYEAAQDVEELLRSVMRRFTSPWSLCVNGREIPYCCSMTASVIFLTEEILQNDLLTLIARTLEFSQAEGAPCLYDDAMNRRFTAQDELLRTLASCVEQKMKGFELVYQPIEELTTGVWRGVEALCRFTSPSDEKVPPSVFIPAIERLGLIQHVGAWVMDTAIRQCKSLNLDTIPDFFLAVNVSSAQLMEDRFAKVVKRIASEHRFPAEKISLEMKESVKRTLTRFGMEKVIDISREGVQFSLDDFGAGYMSFGNLKNMPAKYLKTEHALLENIQHDTYLQNCLRVIAEAAHENNMELIVSGIETQEQLDLIRGYEVDYVQGYYFSLPMPAEELALKIDRFTTREQNTQTRQGEVVNLNQWLSKKNANVITPYLFKILNQCMQVLLSTCMVEQALQRVLEIVGFHVNVERTFAFLRGDENQGGNAFEWCGEGVASEPETIQRINDYFIAPGMEDLLKSSGIIIASDTAQLPPGFWKAAAFDHTQSIALMPMWKEEALLGFVGLESREQRNWQAEEIILLWNLCMILSNMLKRSDRQGNMIDRCHILMDVLDSTGLNVFVSDVNTHDIIWVNNTAKKRFAHDFELRGKKCYKVFQGQQEQCSFCMKKDLLRNAGKGHLTYEHYCERWDHTFVVYDSLIKWYDGQMAHIEYSLDITEQKKAQKKPEYFSTIDLQAGTVNRYTIMKRLREMLHEAAQIEKPLAVAFVDMDGFKHANDIHGHAAGGQLLAAAVKSIREYIRTDDMIGRIGGDEFVVIFPGCKKSMAEARMARARSLLTRSQATMGNEEMSFSYGIVENTELPYSGGKIYLQELLNVANERMHVFKNRTVRKEAQ